MIEVILPVSLMRRCILFGKAFVDDFASGRSSSRRSCFGAEKNWRAQARAKQAECAFAMACGLDPLEAVKWRVDTGPDPGWDVNAGGLLVDVKETTLHGHFLIWSYLKVDLYARRDFHALVLVKVGGRRCRVIGMISKPLFWERKQVATSFHQLKPGTLCLHEYLLTPVEAVLRALPGIEPILPPPARRDLPEAW